MTATRPAPDITGHADRDGPEPARRSAMVLAERMAASLLHHEPGWRLPRYSMLARYYRVSVGEIEAAVAELTARHLLRRLPDGQLYRASPADFLITLDGLPALGARLDPMGNPLRCTGWYPSRRRPPERVAQRLWLPTHDRAPVVRCRWAAGGQPAAVSITYLAPWLADALPRDAPGLAGPATLLNHPVAVSPAAAPAEPIRAAAVQVHVQAPAPSAARVLRLEPGEPALSVTVRFDEYASGLPAALTEAVLRWDLFRVVIESAQSGPEAVPGGRATSSRGPVVAGRAGPRPQNVRAQVS